jgi:hypothetical protein
MLHHRAISQEATMLGIYAKTFMTATRAGEAVDHPRVRPVAKKRSRWKAPAQWVSAPKEF